MTEAEREAGMIEAEVWVYVDSEERVWSHEELDTLKERVAEDGGELAGRFIRVAIKLPVPCMVEVEAKLPAESGECTVTVK